jgi:hypothetical protein
MAEIKDKFFRAFRVFCGYLHDISLSKYHSGQKVFFTNMTDGAA